MIPDKHIEEWEKEFDEKWVPNNAVSTVIPAKGILCGDANEIKAFIRSTLSQARNEAIEEATKIIDDVLAQLYGGGNGKRLLLIAREKLHELKDNV